MFFSGFPGGPSPHHPPSNDNRLYKVLNINRDAKGNEIKKAYHKLAMKWHPDKNSSKEAEERFKDITWAHSVLSDPDKRKLYDQMGEKAVKESGDNPHGPPGHNPFDMFFGGGSRRPPPEDEGPKPVVVRLSLLLSEMYQGGEYPISYKRDIITDRDGEIRYGGTKICEKCGGMGRIMQTFQIGPGMLQQRQVPCPVCNQRGYTMEEGYFLREERETTTVTVPPGADNRQQINLKGRGHVNPRHSGSYGDVVVVLETKSSNETKGWDRKGPHLIYHHKISVFESLTRTTFYVDHPSGKILKLHYSGQITPESVKRLPKMGMPLNPEKTEFGEMFVAFDVYYPKLTPPQQSLIESWIAPPKSIPPRNPDDSPESHTLQDHEAHGRHRPTTQQRPSGPDDQEGPNPGVQCQTQ